MSDPAIIPRYRDLNFVRFRAELWLATSHVNLGVPCFLTPWYRQEGLPGLRELALGLVDSGVMAPWRITCNRPGDVYWDTYHKEYGDSWDLESLIKVSALKHAGPPQLSDEPWFAEVYFRHPGMTTPASGIPRMVFLQTQASRDLSTITLHAQELYKARIIRGAMLKRGDPTGPSEAVLDGNVLYDDLYRFTLPPNGTRRPTE